MLKRLLFSIVCVIGTAICAVAQLASLQPRGMEVLDVADNGDPMNASVEVVFTKPVEGAKISRDNYSGPNKKMESTPTSVYARVIGDSERARGAYGKSITIVHPDYLPCVLDFKELGLTESVKPGKSYRITVDVPASDLVQAHRAFAELDYSRAREYYNRYLATGGDFSALATQRIAMMDKLQKHLDFLNDNAGSSDRSARIKMMKCAKDIYDLTSSIEAYRRYQALRKELIKNARSTDIDGVSEMSVDSVWLDMSDSRAMGDKSILPEHGDPVNSWIIINVNLENLSFDLDGLIADPVVTGAGYILKVAPGADGPQSILIHHADCLPVNIVLKDYGIDEIKRAKVYNVNLTPPAPTVIEADRAFSNLDFLSAQSLYADILQNSDQYPEATVSMVSQKLLDVNSLQDRDFRTTWRRLRDFFVKRPKASREELASRADSLAAMSKELEALKVPGMAQNVRHYTDRAYEYRNSIYLTFTVTEVNDRKEILVDKDGNPKALEAKTLRIEFKAPGLRHSYPVKANSIRPGEFGIYLPHAISEWLISHPGKEMEVIIKDPASLKKYDIQAGRKSGFKFALEDSSDRSISANIYSKALKK